MAVKPDRPDFKSLLLVGGLPDLGPGPRTGVLSETALTQALDPLLGETKLPTVSRELVRGLMLLWHDHLDAAHMIGQGIENADGSFLHGIVHRREPDYGNAAYWFRRVRGHAGFPKIAKRAIELLAGASEGALAEELAPHGRWDPFVMINCCERVASDAAANPQAMLLRQIQGIEIEVLLEQFLES